MKKTTKLKMFLGATTLLVLLFTGCPHLNGGTPQTESEETSINVTFENNFDSERWTTNGLSAEVIENDPVFAKWPQYGDALIDTHGKVLKLSTYDNNSNHTGKSSLTIQKIYVSEASALSFDYKCDLLNWTNPKDGILHQNFFRVFLDDGATPAFEAVGNGQMWQNASIILSPGNHTVQFISSSDDGWYSKGLTNATYLDNITLVPNTIASVDIYPKGLQETYVNGDSIQFTAKALRSDGSVISGKSVSWDSNGGSIDSNGLFTPGSSTGTFTVTATIDGVTTSNETVKVHGVNYLLDSVTINGHTFTGNITYNTERTARSNTNNITFYDPTPADSYFTADGFFVLKGHANNTCVFVAVLKDDGDDTTNKEQTQDYPYQTSYLFKPGDFESRIWLRFGDGDYQIGITEATAEFNEDYDDYEGATKNVTWTYEPGTFTWLGVKNQTGLNYSADDSAFLMPSANCQCDDFLVTNAFNAVMAELPSNATLGQKLQALYDWEARRSHYDYVSFKTASTTKRKRQDDVHVIKYGMCVCEGYADLDTAFARLLGIKSAFQWSAYHNHDWTELYYNNQWKMVDITWDDPSEEGSVDKNPTAENYKYFLINPDDESHASKVSTKDEAGNIIKAAEYDRLTEYYRSAGGSNN